MILLIKVDIFMSNVKEFDSLIQVTKVIINFPRGAGMDYFIVML